jgi:hypothetical protein
VILLHSIGSFHQLADYMVMSVTGYILILWSESVRKGDDLTTFIVSHVEIIQEP